LKWWKGLSLRVELVQLRFLFFGAWWTIKPSSWIRNEWEKLHQYFVKYEERLSTCELYILLYYLYRWPIESRGRLVFFRIIIKYRVNVMSDNPIISEYNCYYAEVKPIILTFKFQATYIIGVSRNMNLYQKRTNHCQRYIIFEMRCPLGKVIFFSIIIVFLI